MTFCTDFCPGIPSWSAISARGVPHLLEHVNLTGLVCGELAVHVAGCFVGEHGELGLVPAGTIEHAPLARGRDLAEPLATPVPVDVAELQDALADEERFSEAPLDGSHRFCFSTFSRNAVRDTMTVSVAMDSMSSWDR